jgi:hypothetical protein
LAIKRNPKIREWDEEKVRNVGRREGKDPEEKIEKIEAGGSTITDREGRESSTLTIMRSSTDRERYLKWWATHPIKDLCVSQRST